MTTPEHHEVRSKHVKAIWGKRCDILFFVRYTNTISFKRTIQGLFFINWMEIINVTWNKPCPIGCGSVGRAVTFDARGPRFESSHRQTFISDIYLFTVNCIEKTKIKKKRPGMAHLKNIQQQIDEIRTFTLCCYKTDGWAINSSAIPRRNFPFIKL